MLPGFTDPTPALLHQRLVFLPASNGCYVNDEQVQPQPGDFYGGWITGDIVGPFKGGSALGLVTSSQCRP